MKITDPITITGTMKGCEGEFSGLSEFRIERISN
jgi:hypothetical protein